MLYYFQTLSLKTRFLGVLLLIFPVLGFSWLLTGTPWALAHLKILSHGVGLPDMQLWYSAQGLQSLIDAWGPEGRSLYLTVLWPGDLALLLSYGAFLTAATLYFLKKTNPKGPWWYLLALVPLVASGFDFLENVAVSLAVLFQPQGALVVGGVATWFTAGKWGFLGVSVAALAGGTVVNLIRRAVEKLRNLAPSDERREGSGQN